MNRGWEPIVGTIEDALVKHPQFFPVRDQMYRHVLSRIAPRSEDALSAEMEVISELTPAENLIRHLNANAPQSPAHFRTMAAGVGEEVGGFLAAYGPTLKMIDQTPLPCALKEEEVPAEVPAPIHHHKRRR